MPRACMIAEPGVPDQPSTSALTDQGDPGLREPDQKTVQERRHHTKCGRGGTAAVAQSPGHCARSLPSSELQQDWISQRQGRGTSPLPQG